MLSRPGREGQDASLVQKITQGADKWRMGLWEWCEQEIQELLYLADIRATTAEGTTKDEVGQLRAQVEATNLTELPEANRLAAEWVGRMQTRRFREPLMAIDEANAALHGLELIARRLTAWRRRLDPPANPPREPEGASLGDPGDAPTPG